MIKDFNFDKEMYKTVGKNIKKYRKLKGLSLDNLAKYAEIEKDYLEKFENLNDDLTISINDIYKISIVLEVSIDKFFK